MKVIFSEEERIEVHEGLKLRQADLQRLMKKLEEARLYSAVREVEDRLEVVARLFRDTMSEEEIAAETGRDPRQLEIPMASEGQSVEEALEGVEEEAAARLLEQEIDRALEYAPRFEYDAVPTACAHERVVVEDGVLRCEDCGEQVPDEHAPIAAEAAAAEVADGHDAP